jgi:hypothetical protein
LLPRNLVERFGPLGARASRDLVVTRWLAGMARNLVKDGLLNIIQSTRPESKLVATKKLEVELVIYIIKTLESRCVMDALHTVSRFLESIL